MTGTTTGQTSLATATDSDDNEAFLTGPLTTDLQAIANLFESATGHDHSGAGKGKPVAAAGIASGAVGTVALAANAVSQDAVVSDASAQSTVATTFAALPNMSVSLTTTGGDVLVFFTGCFAHGTAGAIATFGVQMDAGGYSALARVTAPSANYSFMIPMIARFAAPAAGAHTFNIGWFTSGGTLSADTNVFRYLLAVELKR